MKLEDYVLLLSLIPTLGIAKANQNSLAEQRTAKGQSDQNKKGNSSESYHGQKDFFNNFHRTIAASKGFRANKREALHNTTSGEKEEQKRHKTRTKKLSNYNGINQCLQHSLVHWGERL